MTRKQVLERDSRESMCVYALVKDEIRVLMNVREFCNRRVLNVRILCEE